MQSRFVLLIQNQVEGNIPEGALNAKSTMPFWCKDDGKGADESRSKDSVEQTA